MGEKPHNSANFRQSVVKMHRHRKGDRSQVTLVSAMIRRSGCVFIVLWLFAPHVSASDFGLANPAANDFAEFQSDPRNAGNFARKNPAFDDRTLLTPQQTGMVQHVSDFGAPANDPFPMVARPMPPQASAVQSFPLDWGAATSVVPHNPLVAQHNVIPYDPNVFGPNVFGYGTPQFSMQDMQTMYLAQQQLAQQQLAQQQQFAQQQFAQYLPQYQQEQMMPLVSPYMNPNADMYAQYGYVDPYTMGAYQQNVPNHAAMYQAFLLQDAARRQAEETQTRASNAVNGKGETNAVTPQAESPWTLDNLVPVRVSSPLGETLLVCAKTLSPFVTPTGPDKGVGMPLVNKSWLDHPYYVGGFVGYASGSKELVSNMIEQKSGGAGGFTFGYDFSDYWGLESRVHLASISIRDTDYARQLFAESYQAQFPGMQVPTLTTRTNELTILDAAVHYYPLGNAKWRPYFKYGLGVGRQRFTNTFGYENKADIVTMPLGVGVRYWWNERVAIQADLLNNMVFASNIAKTQNNVSFMVGLTYSFGSGRTQHPIHYWPATPSMGSKW